MILEKYTAMNKNIPHSKNPDYTPTNLWTWSATNLASGIRAKKISSREVTQSCLKRIEEINPHINALTEFDIEEAYRSADKADKEVSNGSPLGPLHGIPISTKINVDERGRSTTNGVRMFAQNIATEDCPSISKVRSAGAVLLGRTNAPAFALRWFSNNSFHGKTLNPWSMENTPGGSSGGAAAAVAVGMMPISIGNDVGGSIRYPSYCCGVTGLRPTVGRIPRWFGPTQLDQPLCVQTMATDGPIARSVSDLRLALSAMSGYDPRDLLSLPFQFSRSSPSKPVRVGLLKEVGNLKNSNNVNNSLDTAAKYLSDAGYIVEEIDLPLLEESYRQWYFLALSELSGFQPMMEQSGDDGAIIAIKYMREVSREWWGDSPTLADFSNTYARRGSLISNLQIFMEKYPIIVLPISTEQALRQDVDIESIEGMRSSIKANWSMMAIANLGFPAVSIPIRSSNNLPSGVQILGRRFHEEDILDAAEIIEAREGVRHPIDPVWLEG